MQIRWHTQTHTHTTQCNSLGGLWSLVFRVGAKREEAKQGSAMAREPRKPATAGLALARSLVRHIAGLLRARRAKRRQRRLGLSG